MKLHKEDKRFVGHDNSEWAFATPIFRNNPEEVEW